MPKETIRRLRLAGASGRRTGVNWTGELRFAKTRRPCVVIDLSCAGARVMAEDVPEGVTQMKLILASGPPIAASLAWRACERIGLRFDAEQDWIADLVVRRFDPAAWVRQP